MDMHELLDRSSERHKHLCPRQVLGVRMGMMAARYLDFEIPQSNKRLLTILETDGCFADGVEVTTGCTIGHRTMRVKDFGKVAAVFVDTKTKSSFRIASGINIRDIADSYGTTGKNSWERQLLGYQTMPDLELFSIAWVTLITPIEEIVSQPGIRVNCEICSEEIINEREVKFNGRKLCQACAGFSYYLPSATLTSFSRSPN